MINEIIEKAMAGNILNKEEVLQLLMIEEVADKRALFDGAKAVRTREFEDRIYLYGFVYFSTWCRNNCNFCYYRRDNKIQRYRKTKGEVLSIAENLEKSGVILLDLTMGEDISFRKDNFKEFYDVIKEIREKSSIPIMISPGIIDHESLDKIAGLGIQWYALYQETHNRDLFAGLRIGQSYDDRMASKLYAKSKGINIEEGIMTGIGEDLSDIADSILIMSQMGARQVRVMSFVGQEGIPLKEKPEQDRDLEHKIIAILRLMNHRAMIPASLDVDGIKGLKTRLNAGANVVTSIIPGGTGLAGVAQATMDIEEGGRTVGEVVSILGEMGLRSGRVDEYLDDLKQ